MKPPAHERSSSRLAVLLPAATIALLLLLRWGPLADAGPINSIVQLNIAVVGLVLFLAAWSNHGWAVGMITFFLLLSADLGPPKSLIEAIWQLNQALTLACLGIHLIVWTELNRKRQSPALWTVCGFCVVGLSSLVWIEVYQTNDYLTSHALERWWTADQRVRHCFFLLLTLGGVLGMVFSCRRGFLWALICLIAPAAGLAIANLVAPVRFDMLFHGARWPELLSEIGDWASQSDVTGVIASWWAGWTTPWLLLPLIGVGLWRAWWRGIRQRKSGNMPVAWLLLLAAGLLLASTASQSSENLRPIGLMWLAIAMPVFAVADLLLLLYEQLALPVPSTGPSEVPHV